MPVSICGKVRENQRTSFFLGIGRLSPARVFMIHLIIDGYNLIRQVPSLARHERESLEAARENLIALLAQYKKIKRHKTTVIFDGVLNLSEFAPAYEQAGIKVRFSPQGISADQVISELVAKEKTRAVVVSSDHAVIHDAEKQGATTITSAAFYEKLIQAELMGPIETEGEKDKTQGHKRWLTYKKGPSKKPPKKKRRERQRLKKL